MLVFFSLLMLQVLHTAANINAIVQIGILGEDSLELSSPRRLNGFKGRKLLTQTPASIFSVQDCATMTGLSSAKKQKLASRSLTKCVRVFDVLVAGHSEATTCGVENNMIAAANLLAQCLDTELQGRVTDPNVVQHIKTFDNNAESSFLLAGCSSDQELHEYTGVLGESYSSQAWTVQGEGDNVMLSVITEEVFHMVHQKAWQYVYPVLAADWSSNLGQCAKAAQCRWYMHPENPGCSDSDGNKCQNSEAQCDSACAQFSVPGQCFATEHNCADAGCDLPEFFHKVYLTYYEDPHLEAYDSMTTAGANTKAGLTEKMEASVACTQLLTDMQNPSYALPRQRLIADYTTSPAPTPGQTAAPTPVPTPAPAGTTPAVDIAFGFQYGPVLFACLSAMVAAHS